ncbi:MAG: lysophospholipid acyltransferase family protein [Oscillospiraceae bacterium]|nr:lysophospholipid acyltransferase family protein [Oscillospiraceae bacterium]
MLLIFLIISVLISALICILAGYTGLTLAGFFLLFTLAGIAGLLLLYILFVGALSLFINRSKVETENHPFYRFILVETVQMVLFLSGARIHAEGLELLPDGAFFLAGNHRSGFDPLIAVYALRKRNLCFISKPSNFRIPIGGALMHKTGFLAIDRDDDRKALRTILAAADRMKRGVACFGVYPEGTRSRTEKMLPFRNGCFKAAQRAQVPIVVASVRNTEKIVRNCPWRITAVIFRICGVIDAATVATEKTAELGDQVRAMLEANLAQ